MGSDNRSSTVTELEEVGIGRGQSPVMNLELYAPGRRCRPVGPWHVKDIEPLRRRKQNGRLAGERRGDYRHEEQHRLLHFLHWFILHVRPVKVEGAPAITLREIVWLRAQLTLPDAAVYGRSEEHTS